MNIIEHGKYLKDNILKCTNCNCKFSITEKDINKVQLYQTTKRIVVCPECKERIYLN